MKCEGSENPPCIRCQKVGRECVPQTTYRQKSIVETRISDVRVNQHASRISSIASIPRPPTNSFRFLPDPKPRSVDREPANDSVIPCIYSTPPVDAVLESRFKPSSSTSSPRPMESTFLRKRKRQSTYSPSNEALTPTTSSLEVDRTLLSRAEMKDMIQLFTQRHLPFMCVFRPQDFEDTDYLIDNDLQVVYCICFVTARYLPGGKEMRERLLPEVIKVPRGVLSMQSGAPHADELSALKSLFILFLYADLTPPSRSSNPSATSEVQFWYLKSVIEVYGTRLGLHRSLQDLRAEMRSNPDGITETRAYQKYIYWLFMFATSHYTSIVSGTPPTIHIDSSIRAAPLVLQEIGGQMLSSCNCNLFGQIDLNLIWEKASAQHPRLGEWWSLPDVSEAVDENSVEAVLRDTDREIDAWYEKWSGYLQASEQGTFLDFTARFTRFCITSYAIKFLRNSPQSLTALQKDQIRRCVACANHVLEWPLGRSPIQKDRLRYVDDTACVMDSFCCLFVISVCQTYASIIPNIFDVLDNVIETAQLMVDLQVGFDDSHMVHVQGSFILKRAESMRTALETSMTLDKQQDQAIISPPASTGSTIPEPPIMFEGLDMILNEEGFYAMEPLWDFSLLFPSV
ncbi:hypothetical protein ONS95_011381 [Cadophora gregata]|uniref:uncharacterized protein n=1 Tax=Cadophora gregata TaxID=51156 RepID=UPI0026DD66AF|nr:uncharacterized protein ONS95_011381 [Cadophora gregata]KAK0119957.1 hypothetical protein ONS95_011381 [Cadophora gregata]